MRKFAQGTSVAPDRSRSEVERILHRFNADQFFYGTDKNKVVIQFRMQNRYVRMMLPLPDPKRFRSQASVEAETRRLWRSLVLAVKSKLDCVQSGIETFEEAFMAHIVLPNGETVGKWAQPQIEDAYKSGKMLPLLPNFGAA